MIWLALVLGIMGIVGLTYSVLQRCEFYNNYMSKRQLRKLERAVNRSK